MKTLFFDIENTPLVSYTWGLYDQNVVAVQKDWELLSVAYSWGEDGAEECYDRQNESTDRGITKLLWGLLNQADIVVAHNAAEFDVKKAMAKFVEHGLGPPSPFVTIDTLKIARSKFKFTSNKLDDLAKLLKVPRKQKTEGISMWLGCMADDPSSWRQMVKYNKQDIVVLKGVYKKLIRYYKAMPSKAAAGVLACACGSTKVVSNGYRTTATKRYRLYRCQDCGRWNQERLGETLKLKQRLVSL